MIDLLKLGGVNLETTAVKKPFFISYILIAINVLLFVIMVFYQPGFSTELTVDTLVTFGAKYNMKIADGEYFRLIASMFLHANLMHIVFNSLALRALGRDAEIFFGRAKFLIIYFVAGLIGALGSYMFNDSIGVGASGAIFGLLGANLYLLTLNPTLYKKIYGNDMLVLLGINLVYGLMNPSIDNVAHLTGMVGGYLAAWSVGLKHQKPFKGKHMAAQAITVFIIVIGLVWGVPNYKNTWKYDYHKGYELLSEQDILGARNQFEKGLSKDPGNENLTFIIDRIDEAIENQN